MYWKKGPIIGRGSTATVSLATTVTGDVIAVKSTELSTSQSLQKEQQFLAKLTSPHVIEYIGFDINYDENIPMYNLLMEYAPRGTVADVIKKQGGCLDERLIRSYTHQILLGLDYIHSKNLIHCDIKCQNLLVCDDSVKICDLDCAKLAGNDGGFTSSVISGTPVYMAPEVARGEEQGFPADVWAVGCAVIEMATGCNPWPEVNNPVSALYKIGYSGEVPMFPVSLSEECKDFLKNCLQINVKERWTVKQLLQHPFVNSESFFEKIENFPNNSPNSILDQVFWDSLEVPESSPENVSGESPVNRISQLVEESISCLPNWVDEEDWITVRVNDEISKNSEHNLYVDVDVDVEGGDDSESTRIDSFLVSEFDVLNEFSNSFRMMLESYIVESSKASVFVSSFLVSSSNDNCSIINSIQKEFALFSPSHFPIFLITFSSIFLKKTFSFIRSYFG